MNIAQITQDKEALKIWILIFIIVFIGGGFLIWDIFLRPPEEIRSVIKNLEIVPSQKSEEGIIFQEGAKAAVSGINLSKVEFYQRDEGAGTYTSQEGVLLASAAKTEVKNGVEKWESSSLPTGRKMAEFCAVGFNAAGNKVGEACLSNVYGKTQEELEKEAQKLQNEILLNDCLSVAEEKYKKITDDYWVSCINSSGDSDAAIEFCSGWMEKKAPEINQKYENLKNDCYREYPQ